MKKKELKETDRKVIETFIKMDWSYGQIAKVLDVNKSTVGREIKNRGTPNGYFADIAQIDYKSKEKGRG